MKLNIKKIVNSDAAYEILDSSNCSGSTWTAGGCAILAQALNMISDYPMYVIYNKKIGSSEHFGVMTPSGSILDADGEHKSVDSWLKFFKKNEMPRAGNLVVIPFDSNIDMEGIHFDEEASRSLVELIKNHKMVRESVRNSLRESSQEKSWYHGTADVRELEKEGGFTQRYLDIEYVDDVDGLEEVQRQLNAAKASGDEDEYFRVLDTVSGFKKNIKIRKPIFLTDTHSIARTYADPHRAFDYQNSKEKVLEVKLKPGRGVTINASGDRFRFIDIDKVRNGFLSAGVDEAELDSVIRKLNFALGVKSGIKTDNIAAIGDWFKFDYIDIIGVLDSYDGGSKKSTVRMVFNPSDITIVTKLDKPLDESAEDNNGNFAKWFDNSKVVDASGKPLVVHHGTSKKFSKFNIKKSTQGIIWFTSSKSSIEAGEVGAEGSGHIMDLYARINKPAGWDEYDKYSLFELDSMGYDGAILPEDGTITGFVFEPSQLKSVKNKGEWSPLNDNIFKESIRKIVREALVENLQLADKVYFTPGLLSPKVREVIIDKITGGDVWTKLVTDIYYAELQQSLKMGEWAVHHMDAGGKEYKEKDVYTTDNDVMQVEKWKEIKGMYQQLKVYNKSVFPIEGLNPNGVKDIWSIIRALKQRAVILEKIKELPSVAIRNMKTDIREPRGGYEMGNYRNSLESFLVYYSQLDNRSEKLKSVIIRKMFKSNVTLEELINFVEEKENLLGGAKFDKKMVRDIVANGESGELEIIYEKDNIMVVEVNGPYGIKEIGCNSLWCFTYGSGWDRNWTEYSYNDMVYAIIDFSEESDSSNFMHVVIKPIVWEPNEDDDEEINDFKVFNMANEDLSSALNFLDYTIGIDNAKRLITFDEEPEEEEEPEEKEYVDPNQLSLFEARKIVREVLMGVIEEEAYRMNHLPGEAALFIRTINQGYDFVLYNPNTKETYAVITVVQRNDEGEDYYVTGVAAERGFGPFIYELAMMHLNREGKGLMPTRDGDVRGDAWNVWERFYDRSDVGKKMLSKDSSFFRLDILGFDYGDFDTEEEIDEWFNEISEEDKKTLTTFNTVYSIAPDEQYKELASRGKKWEEKGFDIQIAIDAGEELWEDKYLNESMEAEFNVYHGSDHKIRKFEDTFLAGEKVTQHYGAGIYFTTNADNARMFGENMYKAHIEGRFIDKETPSKSVNIKEIISLMKMSDEDWEMEAQNYNINPDVGVRIAAQEAINYAENEADVFLRVQSSWYQYRPLDYVRNMTKLGYDGMVVDAPSDWVGDKHIIVFNPDIINIIGSDEIKNEAKNILREEVLEETQTGQKDLEKFANNILKLLAREIVKSRKHNEWLDPESSYLRYLPMTSTGEINGDGFGEIGEFVESTDIKIVPTTLIRGNKSIKGDLEYGQMMFSEDEYKISLRYSDEDIKEVNALFDKEKEIDAHDVYFKIFYMFYSTLLHELQHAYDAWRSGGKAFGGQQKKSYTDAKEKEYSLMQKAIEMGASDEEDLYKTMSPEEIDAINAGRVAYLNLVHEINARYAQAMQKIPLTTIDFDSKTFDNIKKDWNKVYGEFKVYFDGWRHLSDKMKRKLTRRLAKAYQEAIDELGDKKEKINNKDAVIAENNQMSLFEVSKIIREILNEL